MKAASSSPVQYANRYCELKRNLLKIPATYCRFDPYIYVDKLISFVQVMVSSKAAI